MAPERDSEIKKAETDVSQLKPLTFEAGPLTEAEVRLFCEATRSTHCVGVPPTFATIFRKAEFQWLSHMKVDMRNLLHTEQEYEYFEPLEVGDKLSITTSIQDWKERRGMVFTTLASEVCCEGKVKVRSSTSFVLRNQNQENP